MATTIPDELKSADITRFATRAAQIEKAKPAVAYWCYYWIVQQIVTKGLHNASEGAMAYTMQLMEKLETAKATDNDGIKDEIAGQALIEQFGLDVFSRADNTVRANKASRQTADTFQAAYTFLELLQIWPPLDPEISSKIKYAKYHALRIAKAIKAGEDPNLSNPVSVPEPEQNGIVALDPDDPEVRALQGVPDGPRHASVEDVVDIRDPSPLHQVGTAPPNQPTSATSDIPLAKSGDTASPYTHAESYYQTSKDVSPIGPPSNTAPPSIGGGYFPRVSDVSQQSPGFSAINLPSAPADIPDSPLDMSPVNLPTTSTHDFSTPSAGFPPPVPAPQSKPEVVAKQPTYSSIPQPQIPIVPPPEIVDDQAMLKAQKHARWAISALNFEDVPTAVKELRDALEYLGARGHW